MKLGNYEWDPEKDLIAEGAFAEVFRARDRNTLGRTVALKIYKESVAKGTSSSAGQKKYTLEKEFQKVDGLSHTNIITYYGLDYILSKDGLGREVSYPVLIMEYAEGGTLTDFLKTDPDDTTKDKLIRDIIHGLGYLHSEGIIHRDLKPGNILITPNRKGEPVAKITDFGISRDILTDRTVEQSYTEGVGTPHYMAPEQFAKKKYGLNGELSERTDLWALGVIIYKMVTGRMPFGEGETDYEHIREAILEGKGDMTVVPEPYRRMVDRCLQAPADARASDAESVLSLFKKGDSNSSIQRISLKTKISTLKEENQEKPNVMEIDIEKTTQKSPPAKQENEPEEPEHKWTTSKVVLFAVMGIILSILSLFILTSRYNSSNEQEFELKVKQAQQIESTGNLKDALELYRQAYDLKAEYNLLEKIKELEETTTLSPIKGVDMDTTLESYLPDDVFEWQRSILELESSMVFVEGGTFTMGCTSEQGKDCNDGEYPIHKVTLGNFNIGKYEVTQAQWQAVMGENPSHFSSLFTGCHTCPVERVSWDDVQDFLGKLNSITGKRYRLPTEAEWEYAARGGNKSRGYKYSGSNSIQAVAWFSDNSGNRTHPVGQKAPNELGVFDMSGNVWEWCQDWAELYSQSHLNNPRGPSTGLDRIGRGGGWHGNAGYARVSDRTADSSDGSSPSLGFRLAL